MYYMYIHLHGISAFTDWFTGSPPPLLENVIQLNTFLYDSCMLNMNDY